MTVSELLDFALVFWHHVFCSMHAQLRRLASTQRRRQRSLTVPPEVSVMGVSTLPSCVVVMALRLQKVGQR